MSLCMPTPDALKPGRGLLMELPTDSPYLSKTIGIDKAAVVRDYVEAGRKTAFAGDGFPDVDAARLVPDNLRFAGRPRGCLKARGAKVSSLRDLVRNSPETP